MRTTIPTSLLLASALGVGLLTGCGGGSSNSLSSLQNATGGSADPGQTQTYGPLVTRIVGTAQAPVTAGGSGTVVTGIAGAAVTSLMLNSPPITALNSAQILAQSRIAFGRRGQLYTMNGDGTDIVGLTTNPILNYAAYPAWSPDGTKIAVSMVDSQSFHFQIALLNADGTHYHLITHTSADSLSPSWSPDGTKIAFSTYVGNYAQIMTMDTTGAQLTQLSNGTSNDFAPSWSADGSQIAFERKDVSVSHEQIYVMNADGSNAHNIAPAGSGLQVYDLQTPSWSPDGTEIAFTWLIGGHTQVAILQTSTGRVTQLTDQAYDAGSPVWSADGRSLVFSRQNTDITQTGIYTVNVDGTTLPVALTFDNYDASPAIAPYIKTRPLVGAFGSLASSAAGFLYGQNGDAVTSVLAFNATTPANTRISVLTGTTFGNSNYIFSITATDALTSLNFTNDFASPPTVVVSNNNAASGALVSYNAGTGKVSSVLPYIANRAAGSPNSGIDQKHTANVLTIKANFTGIWDETGKNRSPHGASEAQIDTTTGKLLTFH